MEWLIQKSVQKTRQIKDKKKRYLFDVIDFSQKLIIILGYRGTGKTTLLLQYLNSSPKKGIYVSLDDLFFESNRLIDTVRDLYNQGFRLFLLDEVHRYIWWSKDLKQLYDDYDDIQLVVTGSSVMDISKGSADLSRRASTYLLPGLSFREYLYFHQNEKLPKITLPEIISKHHQIAPDLTEQLSIKKEFEKYLHHGYYPFFMEGLQHYFQKLQETLNLVIDTDITPYEELQYNTTRNMKKLLYVISQSVPFTPNVVKLSALLQIPRNSSLKLLDYLNQAQIIHLLKSATKGLSYLQKPEKIYLQNTNFIHLFSPLQPDIGNIRETFFYNQVSVSHQVTAPKYGDFLIDNNYVFEVGGAQKKITQIKGVPNAYLAVDIERGSDQRIPLWFFGMMY